MVLTGMLRTQGREILFDAGKLSEASLLRKLLLKATAALERDAACPSAFKSTAGPKYFHAELAVRHLLRHVQDELAVAFLDFAQQAAKLVEKACIFSDAAPRDVIRRLPFGQIRQLRRFLTVIKELIEWAFERTRKFFQRFNGRNGMAIFHAGNITTQQTCTLLDITLGEFLFFAECAKTVAYNHGGIIPCR